MLRVKSPSSVMVWAGVTANGKTPLVFIEKGVKINASYYQKSIIKAVLEPWAKLHFKGEDWTLQQDWAPAHKAKGSIALCKKLFPKIWDRELWPPYSPDLNPMDFAIWPILEQKACSVQHRNLESLKAALLKAWAEIPTEQLSAAISSLPDRLSACVKAQGGHFE